MVHASRVSCTLGDGSSVQLACESFGLDAREHDRALLQELWPVLGPMDALAALAAKQQSQVKGSVIKALKRLCRVSLQLLARACNTCHNARMRCVPLCDCSWRPCSHSLWCILFSGHLQHLGTSKRFCSRKAPLKAGCSYGVKCALMCCWTPQKPSKYISINSVCCTWAKTSWQGQPHSLSVLQLWCDLSRASHRWKLENS